MSLHQSPKLGLISDCLAGLSGFFAVATWQEQLDWSIRIIAGLLAAIAAFLSIRHRLRKPPINHELYSAGKPPSAEEDPDS